MPTKKRSSRKTVKTVTSSVRAMMRDLLSSVKVGRGNPKRKTRRHPSNRIS